MPRLLTEDVPRSVCQEQGLYLYCLTEAKAGAYIDGLAVKGIDLENTVFSIAYRDLRAVISKVSLDEFGEEGFAQRLKDMSWVEAKGILHVRVVKQVMSRYTVIPMRFGIVYKNEDRILAILAENYAGFQEVFNRLRDKEEWGLKVFYDPETLSRFIRESNKGITRLENEMASSSTGMAYFLKKKVEKLLQEEVERLSFTYAEECHQSLRKLAADSRLNELMDRQLTGKDSEMILNAAYLVEKEKIKEFSRELAHLQSEYQPKGLEFSLSGPWPPYNFTSVKIKGEGGDV